MEELEQKNKYYTPEIEEFRVGFEFEYKETFLDGTVKSKEQYDKAKWIKSICWTESMPYIERTLTGKNFNNYLVGVRVKYLDEDDIKDLGFIPSYNKPKYWFQSFKGNNEIQLYYDDKTKEEGNEGIGITIYDGRNTPPNDNKVFNGFIKNKSELKVLMKQLGICQ